MNTIKSSEKIIYLAGLFATLAIWPSFMEPFNFPKFCVLLVISAVLLSRNFSNVGFNKIFRNVDFFSVTVVAFITYFWVRSLLNSDVYSGIFGSYGRYTGALTYTCWMLILLQGSVFRVNFNAYTSVKYFYWTSSIVYAYGILQLLDRDILGWEAMYDGVFSTLGNPNFLSAFTSLVICASVWLLLYPNKSFPRIIPSIFIVVSIIIQGNTSSLQGYVLSVYSVTLLIILKLYDVRNKLWIPLTLVSAIAAIFGVMGILNYGPLRSILFQTSNVYRLDFWRTGINMIQENPFFGVGIERYGSVFREYREKDQVFRTDPNQTSDSAHNLAIHLGATGGLFLVLLLIIIVLIILYKSLNLFRSRNQINFAILFFVMSTTTAIQNLLSVDNLPLSTWQWIFFAGLISLSNDNSLQSQLRKSELKNKKSEGAFHKYEFREMFLRCILIMCSLLVLFRPISSQLLMKSNFYLQVDLEDNQAVEEKYLRLDKTLDRDPKNIFLARLGANSLYIDQAWDKAVKIASRGVTIDAEDYVVWWFLASSLEESGKIAESIRPRQMTIELDPFNYFNYYLLCNSYAKLGYRTELEKCAEKLFGIAPNSKESQEVQRLLIS